MMFGYDRFVSSRLRVINLRVNQIAREDAKNAKEKEAQMMFGYDPFASSRLRVINLRVNQIAREDAKSAKEKRSK